MNEEIRPNDQEEPKPEERLNADASGSAEGARQAGSASVDQAREQPASATDGIPAQADEKEPVAQENQPETADAAENRSRRRLRLNPKVSDPSQLKPVPSLGTPAGAGPLRKRRAEQRDGEGGASSQRPGSVPSASQPAQQPTEVEPQPAQASAEQPSAESSSAGGQPWPQQESRGDSAVELPPAQPAASEAGTLTSQSQETGEGPTTDETDQAETEVKTATASPAAEQPADVELPPKDIELGAELEAEIEAALADGLSTSVAAPEGEQTAKTRVSVDDVPAEGARLKGQIQSIHGEDVFVDLGYRSPAVVSIRQFPSDKPPVVGNEVEVVVARFDPTDGLIVCNLPTGVQRLASDWDAVEVGQTVECMVSAVVKGGLEVRVGSLRGFMPASQVDLGYVADLEPYVGQKLKAKIIEADPRRRNMVVSRRELLAEERRQAEEQFWKTIEEGQVLTGRVKKIMDYGAFVDLGPVDGFLHVGQISWTRINHPSEVLSEGQEVEVKVISVEPETKRVGLSLKQLTDNPWATAAERYEKGKVYPGRVTRIADFGAFVELEPGIEGLVHISELTYRRVNKVADVVKEGQEVEVQVLNVDTVHRRIALSMKVLEEKPPEMKSLAEAQKEAEESGAKEPARPKRKRPLKGGLDSSSGPLFGDPRLFGK